MISRSGFQAGGVEGVREVVRAIGQIDPALRKKLGQKNKEIGQRIIDRSTPKPLAVGAGAGAIPRASATTSVLRIVAGGAWRQDRRQQWGKKVKERATKRPYIRRAAEKMMPWGERAYLDALLSVAREAGFRVEKR